MQFKFFNRRILSDIPSASGIEIVQGKIFAMGDDSPWLFRLNEKFETIEKIQLTDTIPSGNKIPKALKTDLEAMAAILHGSHTELLLFGSGSKSPERDVLIRLNTEHPHYIKKYSLDEFYEKLRNTANLSKDELNIEAAVVLEKYLYLFNRGKNMIVRLDVNFFLSYIEGNGNVPSFDCFQITLPSLKGIESGFSGACATPDLRQIVFTASVENTSNWIDDGEILGSFVGIFPVSELKNALTPACIAIADTKNTVLKIKVESVAIYHPVSANCFNLLMVTDNDGSTSELIEAELNF